jgi:dienelactone hydrolase
MNGFLIVTALASGPFAFSHPAQAKDGYPELKRQFDYDATAPLQVEQRLLHERDSARVFDVSYASPKGGRVTAYLVTPIQPGRHPAVLFGHWGPGNRTEFLPEATLYARAGAVSLLVDYPWVRPAPWRKELRQADDPASDHEAFVQAVVDLRRGIDLLEAQEDIDPDRVAYVGHSFGAQWGAILSAVDQRLKGAVLMAGVPDQAAIWRDNDDPAVVAFREATPKERLQAYLDTCDKTAAVRYVPHAACPLYIQFARFERYFSIAAMERYIAAAPQSREVRWYDTGHELNDPRALIDRAAWLGSRIGLGPIGAPFVTQTDGK